MVAMCSPPISYNFFFPLAIWDQLSEHVREQITCDALEVDERDPTFTRVEYAVEDFGIATAISGMLAVLEVPYGFGFSRGRWVRS